MTKNGMTGSVMTLNCSDGLSVIVPNCKDTNDEDTTENGGSRYDRPAIGL